MVSPRGRSAEIEEMLTIAPPCAVRIIAGIAYFESRNMLSTLTCITLRYCSAFSSTTLPLLPMPTLLSRKSRRPKRSTVVSTRRLQSSSSVTSPATAAAVPPSAAIILAVLSARSRLRSATITLVPARASKIAAARPLPMPSPAAPPPEISATLPARPASSSGPFMSSFSLLVMDDSNADEEREARQARGWPARVRRTSAVMPRERCVGWAKERKRRAHHLLCRVARGGHALLCPPYSRADERPH